MQNLEKQDLKMFESPEGETYVMLNQELIEILAMMMEGVSSKFPGPEVSAEELASHVIEDFKMISDRVHRKSLH